jgi:hypothetical protein
MSLITKKYNDQQFGKYTFQVCSKTKFLEAKGMLEIYNATAVKKQKMGKMNEYMRGKAFQRAVCSDFDKTSKDSKLDLDYLKQLCEKRADPKKGSAFPPEDSDSETFAAWALKLTADLKFAYMVRETSTTIGNSKKISAIDIHPLVGIGLAMWLSDEFASEVKDAFLKLVTGDLTLLKDAISRKNAISGKIHNIQTATNPENGQVEILVKTHEKDSEEASSEYEELHAKIKELQEQLKQKSSQVADLTADYSRLQSQHKKIEVDHMKEIKDMVRANEKERKKECAKAEEREKERKKECAKAEERERKAEARYQQLIGTAEDTKEELIDQGKTLKKIAKNHVMLEDIDFRKHPHFLILQDPTDEDVPFYVIRCQKYSMENALQKIKKKFPQLEPFIALPQPNAVGFFNLIREKLGQYIEMSNTRNWFSLNEMSAETFKVRVTKLNRKRQEADLKK